LITSSYVDPVGVCFGRKIFLFLPEKPKMFPGRRWTLVSQMFKIKVRSTKPTDMSNVA
jgi:hypothetical protein